MRNKNWATVLFVCSLAVVGAEEAHAQRGSLPGPKSIQAPLPSPTMESAQPGPPGPDQSKMKHQYEMKHLRADLRDLQKASEGLDAQLKDGAPQDVEQAIKGCKRIQKISDDVAKRLREE